MGNKLYVGNLPYSVRDGDLEQAFSAFGAVTSAKVMMERDTGRSKGFGFVEMGSDSEAQAAIEGMNGQPMGGRSLVVESVRRLAFPAVVSECQFVQGVAAPGSWTGPGNRRRTVAVRCRPASIPGRPNGPASCHSTWLDRLAHRRRRSSILLRQWPRSFSDIDEGLFRAAFKSRRRILRKRTFLRRLPAAVAAARQRAARMLRIAS